MTQQRQPRGQATGGQFAPDVNPESTLVLVDPVRETLEAGSMCLQCGRGSGFVNRIPGSETTKDGLLTVNGYTCAECANCQDGLVAAWCGECEEFTYGYSEGAECSQCGEAQDLSIPVPADEMPEQLRCTQCTGETTFDFEAFAQRLKADTELTKIGGELSGGTKIVAWAEPAEYTDRDVVLQTREMEDINKDCDPTGWSFLSLAQMLKIRKVKTATASDVLAMFDHPDTASIAFDPKRGVNQVLMEINETLRRLQ